MYQHAVTAAVAAADSADDVTTHTAVSCCRSPAYVGGSSVLDSSHLPSASAKETGSLENWPTGLLRDFATKCLI